MRPTLARIVLLTSLMGCGSAASPQGAPPSRVASLKQAASPDTRVTLRPMASASLCVTVAGDKNEDGAEVVLAACEGRTGQLWQRAGTHVIAFGDKCLNVPNGDGSNGRTLKIFTCRDDDNHSDWQSTAQQLVWRTDSGSQCMDVKDGVFANNTALQLWECAGPEPSPNQAFGWTYETGALSPAAEPGAKPPAPAPAHSTAKFRVAIHIDYDNGSTNGVAGFVQRTGTTPAMTAGYVRAKADGSFELDTSKRYIDEAASHHVPAVSLALTSNQGGRLTDAQLDAIAQAVAYGVSKKLSVEVRFGYEMNGNWSPSFHNNDPTTFKTQWAQLAPRVHKAGGIMVWSPNNNGGPLSNYERWLPDDISLVDALALDFYHLDSRPVGNDEVANAIGLIYPLCQKFNLPFYFGETAVTVHDGSFHTPPSQRGLQMKRAWLDQLVREDILKKFPLYRGFTWFDYNKTESNTGLAGGVVTANRFTISQDEQDAALYRTWRADHPQID